MGDDDQVLGLWAVWTFSLVRAYLKYSMTAGVRHNLVWFAILAFDSLSLGMR